MKAGFIGVGIGSNLIPKELMSAEDWDGAAVYVKGFFAQIGK